MILEFDCHDEMGRLQTQDYQPETWTKQLLLEPLVTVVSGRWLESLAKDWADQMPFQKAKEESVCDLLSEPDAQLSMVARRLGMQIE